MHTKEVENKRRSFWIESMKMFLVMSRELIKQSEPVKKNKQYSFSTNENYECVLCDEQHIDKGVVLLSLSRCPMFREMNVENRISAVVLWIPMTQKLFIPHFKALHVGFKLRYQTLQKM